MFLNQLECWCFGQPIRHFWPRSKCQKMLQNSSYENCCNTTLHTYVIWIITLVNSVLMSLMVSVTSFKCSPMTIAQMIMQGLPEGMATLERQVIPQYVPCPQSDPISFLPNSTISSKHGHFGLQKKTRLGWRWRHTWKLQNCGPQTNRCLCSC